MRVIGCLVLVISTLGWLACHWPLVEPGVAAGAPELRLGHGGRAAERLAATPDALAHEVSTTWRRTADGWEHPTWWIQEPEPPRPKIHPLVVGLLQLFVALFALIAFSPSPGGASGHAARSRRNPRGAAAAAAGKPAR